MHKQIILYNVGLIIGIPTLQVLACFVFIRALSSGISLIAPRHLSPLHTSPWTRAGADEGTRPRENKLSSSGDHILSVIKFTLLPRRVANHFASRSILKWVSTEGALYTSQCCDGERIDSKAPRRSYSVECIPWIENARGKPSVSVAFVTPKRTSRCKNKTLASDFVPNTRILSMTVGHTNVGLICVGGWKRGVFPRKTPNVFLKYIHYSTCVVPPPRQVDLYRHIKACEVCFPPRKSRVNASDNVKKTEMKEKLWWFTRIYN